jgi:hypothetical protein
MLGLKGDYEEANIIAAKKDRTLAHALDLYVFDDLDWPITAARIVKIAKSLG